MAWRPKGWEKRAEKVKSAYRVSGVFGIDSCIEEGADAMLNALKEIGCPISINLDFGQKNPSSSIKVWVLIIPEETLEEGK